MAELGKTAADPHRVKQSIEQRKGDLLKDSYRWILHNSNFQQWRDDPGSRLLGITGDAGKGKTMLLYGIINELRGMTAMESTNAAEYTRSQDRQGGRLAYFFCKAANDRVNNATAVLCGLIRLLVDQKRSLLSHVRKQYDIVGETFQDVNTWFVLSEIFDNIVQDPILDCVYVIIDALDECVTD